MDDGYLVVREMEDDNSCLFHAIGYIFERNAAVAGNLRKVVSENILKDPVTYNEVILGKKESEYAKWILNAQSWGGAIELALFSTHFQVEICNGELLTGCFCVVFWIHYDAVALTPEIGAAGEFDVTVFERKDAEKALEAALGLAKMWKEKKKFTDLATFTLKCGHCQKGLKGQNEAQEHALKTGHASFTEYS
ncbi:hypothetical protein BC829DRAFT_425697 [Chytridium lagenaria]|nr:hypothetical protein BC829DRAFT_425697 [Chytridium lagenaria]